MILLSGSLLGTGCSNQNQSVINSEQTSSTLKISETTDNWTTYTTYAYGFEFKYPGTTQSIQHYMSKPGTYKDEERTARTMGEATQLYFSTKWQDTSLDFEVGIQSLDYQPYYYEKYDSFDVAWANKIDFTKTNEQIASTLLPQNTDIIKIEKLIVDSVPGVRLELHEEPFDYNKVYYIFPKFNQDHSLNLVIAANPIHASILQEIIGTLKFNKK
jgi:hypothetical protein